MLVKYILWAVVTGVSGEPELFQIDQEEEQFDTLEECHAAVPTILSMLREQYPDDPNLNAFCSDLQSQL